jgi:hypothetical protein
MTIQNTKNDRIQLTPTERLNLLIDSSFRVDVITPAASAIAAQPSGASTF